MALKVIYNPKGRAREYSEYALNIYNGCDFGCKYCLDKDTLILKSDLKSVKIKDLKIGDKIIGVSKPTNKKGNLKFVESIVEHIWITEKEVCEIELENGMNVKCSKDHRWLTDRGWKYVTGSESGLNRRPFLTENNYIRILSPLQETPFENEEYIKGYLSGMIRGDGHLKTYNNYERDVLRKDRNNKIYHIKENYHRFYLRLADKEPIDKVNKYLSSYGIVLSEFRNKQNMFCVATSRKEDFQSITQLINWSNSFEYRRGFLSGIFDAEGSYLDGKLRISNSDLEIIGFIQDSFKLFGFNYEMDVPCKTKNKLVNCIRLVGGRESYVRFIQLIDPCINRKRNIINQSVKSNSKIKKISLLGYTDTLYDIQTSTSNFIANGMISHNCFVPLVLKRNREDFHKDLSGRNDFLKKVESDCIKLEGLKERVLLCFTCDPYNSLDLELQTTRKVLELFKKYNINFQILTKGGNRARRDFDLYKKDDAFATTLTFTNDEKSKLWEVNAPLPSDRMDTLKYAHSIGIETWVSLEPVVDPSESLKLIELTHEYVDFYKVGTLNYDKLKNEIDWKEFGLAAIELLEKYNKKYYIKEDLKKFLL